MKTIMERMREIQELTDNMVKEASELNSITAGVVNDFCQNENYENNQKRNNSNNRNSDNGRNIFNR